MADSITIAQLKQMVQTLPSKKRPLAKFDYLRGLKEAEREEFCSYFEADFYKKCLQSKGTTAKFLDGDLISGMFLLGQVLQGNTVQIAPQSLYDMMRHSEGELFEVSLSLLYFVVTAEDQLEPCPIRHLFQLTEKVNESTQKNLPLKKILLLLWKLMDFKFRLDLTPSDKKLPKVTPHEMAKIQTNYQKRFAQFQCNPSEGERFILKNFDFAPVPPQQLKEDQPATKSPPMSPTSELQGDDVPKMQLYDKLPLIFGKVPISVVEGYEIYRQSSYISKFSKQLCDEKILMTGMGYNLTQGCSEQEADELKSRLSLAQAGGFKLSADLSDDFFAENIRDFGSFFIVLLKIFLALCGTSSSQTTSPVLLQISQHFNGAETSAKLSQSEVARRQLEQQRQKEIGAKAISFIMLLMLKKAKQHHACLHEYFCQLLADSNCILLTLKILNQDVAGAMTKNDEDFAFLQYSSYMSDSPIVEDDEARDKVEDEEIIHVCQRNFHMTINMLRVVQMLVKNKPGRIAVLLQFKGPQILRKMLKGVENEWLNLYTYKILKNMVPVLGRKWRQNNMKVITGIYTHLRPDMTDDWLQNYTENALVSEESQLQERKLRNLIHFHLAREYGYNLLRINQPVQHTVWTFEHVDANGDKKTFAVPVQDQEPVDQLFKINLRAWLELEVYSKKLDMPQNEPEVSIASSPEQSSPEPVQLDSKLADSTILSQEDIAEDVVFDNEADFDVFSGDGTDTPDEDSVVHVDEVEDRSLHW